MNCEFCFCQKGRCVCRAGMWDRPSPPGRGVLQEAMAVVGARGDDYDHPAANHERIAALWSVILEQKVTPLQVVNCMIAVKLARLIPSPNHWDTIVDIAGYANCAGEIINARER